MDEKYKTAHFVLGETAPETEPQKSLSDIVFLVKSRLADALTDEATGLRETHPKTLIAMVVTNILVNLLTESIGAPDAKRRQKMVSNILQEINDMTFELWNALEANRADITTAH